MKELLVQDFSSTHTSIGIEKGSEQREHLCRNTTPSADNKLHLAQHTSVPNVSMLYRLKRDVFGRANTKLHTHSLENVLLKRVLDRKLTELAAARPPYIPR